MAHKNTLRTGDTVRLVTDNLSWTVAGRCIFDDDFVLIERPTEKGVAFYRAEEAELTLVENPPPAIEQPWLVYRLDGVHADSCENLADAVTTVQTRCAGRGRIFNIVERAWYGSDGNRLVDEPSQEKGTSSE